MISEKYKKLFLLFFSAAFVAGLFLYFHSITPFVYLTNDDFFLKTLASGEVTGSPDPRLWYIGYPAGLLISSLYRLFPSAPWYGLFLCLSFGITIFAVLYHMLRLEKTLPARLLTLLFFFLLAKGFLLLHIAEIQFTTVTGMTGAGALFLFAVSENSPDWKTVLKNNLGFLLLSAWAFSIRDKAFLMLFPFLGMIGIAKYLDAAASASPAYPGHSSLFRLNPERRNLFRLLLVFVLLLGLVWGMNKAAYRSSAWTSFGHYTDCSETIYDYDGYPDYDTHQDLYKSLGITRSSYEAAAHHYNILLEPSINEKTMSSLASVAEAERTGQKPGFAATFKNMASFFVDRNLSYTDRPLNLLVYSLYFLFFLLAAVCRRKQAVRDLVFLFIARMAVWSYLTYYGRLPSRVSQAVYLAELMVLLAICCKSRLWERSCSQSQDVCGSASSFSPLLYIRRYHAIWYLTLAVLLVLTFRFGLPKSAAAVSEASSRLRFSDSYQELTDYFRTQPDSFFYLDMNSFGSFTQEALKSGQNQYANYLFMGSWVPHSPWYDTKFSREGITDPARSVLDSGKVYLVFMKSSATSWQYLSDFYHEKYPGSALTVVKEIKTSEDVTFEILKGKR